MILRWNILIDIIMGPSFLQRIQQYFGVWQHEECTMQDGFRRLRVEMKWTLASVSIFFSSVFDMEIDSDQIIWLLS